MHFYKRHLPFFFLVICDIVNIYSVFERSFFYRTSSFYGEPRFEKKFLIGLEAQVSGGDTNISYNNCDKLIPFAYSFGLNNLSKKSERLLYNKGSFNILEFDLNYFQNFNYGLFYHFHIPIAKIDSSIYYQKSILNYKEHGLSDSTLFLGWTTNYEQIEYLDYIDFSFQAGILFPSGKKRTKNLLSIPLGYNGHWGIPICIDLSFGLYDWLTLGTHFDSVSFLKHTEKLIIKNDYIYLFEPKQVDPGFVFRTGGYIKADHFMKGLSLLIGIDQEQQSSSNLNSYIEQYNIWLKPWNRTQIHLLVEYDLASPKNNGPRIGICYDKNLRGKNIFGTNTLDSYIGLDFELNF